MLLNHRRLFGRAGTRFVVRHVGIVLWLRHGRRRVSAFFRIVRGGIWRFLLLHFRRQDPPVVIVILARRLNRRTQLQTAAGRHNLVWRWSHGVFFGIVRGDNRNSRLWIPID